MGNNHQLLSTWSIKFVQNMDDPHFGNIDIYKNDEGQFLMCIKRTFIKAKQETDPRLKEFMQFVNQAHSQHSNCIKQKTKSSQHQILSPILHINKSEENNICLAYEIFETYTQYLNFTLADMIKYRKEMDSDQLWLCFRWMLRMAALMIEKGWQFQDKGNLLKNIFVTLKGHPVIYHYQLHKKSQKYEPQQFLEPKTSPTKIQTEQQPEYLYEIAMCILQLACMTQISPLQNNQLYLRKCTKINENLGAILNQILNNLHKNPNLNINNLLNIIKQLQNSKRITFANSIRLNKFRYAIPKPDIPQKIKQQRSNEKKKELQTLQRKQSPSSSRITILNGRKNTSKKNSLRMKIYTQQNEGIENMIQINSLNQNQQNLTKKKILQSLQSKGLSQYTSNNSYQAQNPLKSGKNTHNQPMLGLLSSFKEDLAEKKRKAEGQKQKMSQRKQKMMQQTYSTNKQNHLSNSTFSTKNRVPDIRGSFKNKTAQNKSSKNTSIRQSFHKNV